VRVSTCRKGDGRPLSASGPEPTGRQDSHDDQPQCAPGSSAWRTRTTGRARFYPIEEGQAIRRWRPQAGISCTRRRPAVERGSVTALRPAMGWGTGTSTRSRSVLQQGPWRPGRLGAPRVARGSKKARRTRQLFGGGMRPGRRPRPAALYGPGPPRRALPRTTQRPAVSPGPSPDTPGLRLAPAGGGYEPLWFPRRPRARPPRKDWSAALRQHGVPPPRPAPRRSAFAPTSRVARQGHPRSAEE